MQGIPCGTLQHKERALKWGPIHDTNTPNGIPIARAEAHHLVLDGCRAAGARWRVRRGTQAPQQTLQGRAQAKYESILPLGGHELTTDRQPTSCLANRHRQCCMLTRISVSLFCEESPQCMEAFCIGFFNETCAEKLNGQPSGCHANWHRQGCMVRSILVSFFLVYSGWEQSPQCIEAAYVRLLSNEICAAQALWCHRPQALGSCTCMTHKVVYGRTQVACSQG